MNVPQIVNGVFSGNGTSDWVRSDGDLFLHLSDGFNATIQFEIADPPSPQGATPTFSTLGKDASGNPIQFTQGYSGRILTGPKGMLWRLKCSGYVAGPITYKLIG